MNMRNRQENHTMVDSSCSYSYFVSITPVQARLRCLSRALGSTLLPSFVEYLIEVLPANSLTQKWCTVGNMATYQYYINRACETSTNQMNCCKMYWYNRKTTTGCPPPPLRQKHVCWPTPVVGRRRTRHAWGATPKKKKNKMAFITLTKPFNNKKTRRLLCYY